MKSKYAILYIFIFALLPVLSMVYAADVESIWEYPGGAFGKMKIALYADGIFLYTISDEEKYKGRWELDSKRQLIVLTFDQDKQFWDKIIFEEKQFINALDKSIGYYDYNGRRVGFMIFKDIKDGSEYIDFLGFLYYKREDVE